MTEPPVPPASLGSGPTIGDTPTEPPAADTIRTTRITIGTWVALAGSAAVAMSSVLAWANQPYVPFDNPVYPEVFSVPALINPESSGRIPSAAVVLLAFGGISGVLALIRPLGRWVDPLRRVLGLIVLGVCVLFLVRYSAVYEDGLGMELVGDLRAGFYLAAVGGLLIVAGGRVRD